MALSSQVGLAPVGEEGEGVGGAGGDGVGHVGEGVPGTGRLLVPVPRTQVGAAPPAAVAAGQLQALVHPPLVVVQARLHSVHSFTLVTVVGGVVLLHVDVQVFFDQKCFSTYFAGKLAIVCMSVHMSVEG